eukprot:2604455-Rhodomonas_salina.1
MTLPGRSTLVPPYAVSTGHHTRWQYCTPGSTKAEHNDVSTEGEGSRVRYRTGQRGHAYRSQPMASRARAWSHVERQLVPGIASPPTTRLARLVACGCTRLSCISTGLGVGGAYTGTPEACLAVHGHRALRPLDNL